MNGNSIPKWKLEWYLAGALPAEELILIAQLEQSDDKLRGRIEALRADNEEILAKYRSQIISWETEKTELVGAGVSNKDAKDANRLLMKKVFADKLKFPQPPSFTRWAIPAFACAALFIVLPALLVLPITEHYSEKVYATRTKGEISEAAPGLEVWRKAGDGAEKLAPEATVSAGDIVQLRYIVPHSCYGALLSMDGRGVLTVHLSGNDGQAVPLTPGRPVALKTSYKLDDAPAFEAFYLITAQNNFNLESVRQILMDVKHPIDDEQILLLPEKQVAAFTLRKYDGKGVN